MPPAFPCRMRGPGGTEAASRPAQLAWKVDPEPCQFRSSGLSEIQAPGVARPRPGGAGPAPPAARFQRPPSVRYPTLSHKAHYVSRPSGPTRPLTPLPCFTAPSPPPGYRRGDAGADGVLVDQPPPSRGNFIAQVDHFVACCKHLVHLSNCPRSKRPVSGVAQAALR